MKLQCEWDGCGSEYEVEAFNGFRDHVEEHLKDLLPGYCVDGCSDVLPQDFTCPWSDCGWDSPGEVHEFIRHCFFHAFHTRLKVLGFLKQQEIKLPQCTLDSQTRNLVPDFPEPFVCEWESCHMEFNCPYRFFHHVDAHAMACDKTDAVGVHNSGHRASIRVYCQWTDCKFFSKGHYKLREHCRSHTREKLFACVTCGGMFANRTKFIDHLKRQNSSGHESFQCSHCLKHCGSQRILRDHMRHHVNSIKCQFCDMTCPNPSALKQHIRFRHSEERPYSCDMCNYSCKTASDLRRHRESHNAVFGYQCTVEGCDFTARAMQTLKRHHKVEHQGVEIARYECHMCGNRYTRGSGLTYHLKTKHKFRWPAGHPRFRYKEHEDGILRLQTVRFESVELSQQLNAPQDIRENTAASSSAIDQNSSSSATYNEVDENVDVDGDGIENCESTSEANVPNVEPYNKLLEQYEEHEGQTQNKISHHEPVRRETHTKNRYHPYQRTEEIVSHTLLALQEAAVHIVRQ